jgi:hypothetical protein
MELPSAAGAATQHSWGYPTLRGVVPPPPTPPCSSLRPSRLLGSSSSKCSGPFATQSSMRQLEQRRSLASSRSCWTRGEPCVPAVCIGTYNSASNGRHAVHPHFDSRRHAPSHARPACFVQVCSPAPHVVAFELHETNRCVIGLAVCAYRHCASSRQSSSPVLLCVLLFRPCAFRSRTRPCPFSEALVVLSCCWEGGSLPERVVPLLFSAGSPASVYSCILLIVFFLLTWCSLFLTPWCVRSARVLARLTVSCPRFWCTVCSPRKCFSPSVLLYVKFEHGLLGSQVLSLVLKCSSTPCDTT